MSDEGFFRVERGSGPLVATAIHDGHAMREELRPLLSLSEEGRLREEDPFTGRWTTVAPTRVVVGRSRFEVDLNRPRDKAVYQRAEDAWGLQVWKTPLPGEMIERSLEEYDAFYVQMEALLRDILAREGHFVVLDLHSYNYRRAGPEGPAADPAGNPEVNVGTGTLDHERWGGVLETLMQELSSVDVAGRHLDVRENVKFYGGNMTRWINNTFAGVGCSLAIELKKFFMDEWTGELFEDQHQAIHRALSSVAKKLTEVLDAR